MAHTCPECGYLCHCGGDIEDMDWGELSSCTHYLSCEAELPWDEDDDLDWSELRDDDDRNIITGEPED